MLQYLLWYPSLVLHHSHFSYLCVVTWYQPELFLTHQGALLPFALPLCPYILPLSSYPSFSFHACCFCSISNFRMARSTCMLLLLISWRASIISLPFSSLHLLEVLLPLWCFLWRSPLVYLWPEWKLSLAWTQSAIINSKCLVVN